MLKARKFTAHAPCHVTCKQGVKNDHTFGIPVAILPIHYTTFYGATMTIKGSLHMKVLYRGGRSVGRSSLFIKLMSYTPLRYVRNVAREE